MLNNVTRNICTSPEFVDQGSDRRYVRRSESGAKTALRGKTGFSRCASRFFRTGQQEGQSITDFLAELRNKAKECDFEQQCCVKCQDNALRDRLVMGCRHTFIQQAILKKGDASLTNVLQCAKMAELLSKELCKMHEQTRDHTAGNTQQEVHAVRHSQPSRQKQRFRVKQRPEHAERGQADSPPFQLTVNLTGKTRKSAIDVDRLLIITETVRSSTPSATGVIAKDTYRLYAGRPGSQSEKGKWLNTRWNNEQRISQWTCSLLPHTSINRRFYYKSRTSTYSLS